MPLCKLHAWFQNVLPTVYDSASLSLYEAMGKVMYKLNEVIDLVNLLEANQPNVEDYVINILNKWLDDGTLANIINNDVLNNKADGHVLSVSSFGADPTGVKDSTQAFNDALAKASNDKYKLVVFPGQYKLSSYIFTDSSFFVSDLGFYPDSKLIYCNPLKGKLSAQNFYSFQYQYDTPQTSNAPIPWETQGIFFDRSTNLLYCAYQGAFTISSFDGSSFKKLNTVINSNIGHGSTITMDSSFIYISESPANGLVKFSKSDLSFQGQVSLPNVSPDDWIAHFGFNPSSNLFYADVVSSSTYTSKIFIFDKNLNFIKSFPVPPLNGVVQSSAWIENNYIAISEDSNWSHDDDFGSMFLHIIDICSEKIVYSFPFGNIRAFNECQGLTTFDNDGNYIIYSYAQQTNIQSLFKFNFKKDSNSNFINLESTNESSIASIYPNKKIVVNSKGSPYPFNGTIIQNNNNVNDNIPIGSDIINVNPLIKGSASFPFATPQAAAANVGRFGSYSILLCGDTNFSIAPNGHLVIFGADNITISSIANNTNRMLCPPIFIENCKSVTLKNLVVSNTLDFSAPHNHHNWASLHIAYCSNVYIENCEFGFASETDAKNSSGFLEVGAGIYINFVSNFRLKSSSTTNCRAGLAITNSNFIVTNYSITNNKYGAVIGNTTGTRSDNSTTDFYSYYLSDNPNFTTNINYAGTWNG